MENLSNVGERHALSKPITSNSVSTLQESKGVNNDKVIAPGMFRISPDKTSREGKKVPNTVRASNRTKPITVSQPPVFIKKDVNSNLNGLSSTGVDNTKNRRPQPRSNTKNDMVPSASKSSRSKNKEAKVEEHHRNLLLSKNNKHMSLACNNIKIDSQDVISNVVCAMCNKCLISVNHDNCLRNYVNDKNSCGKKQKAKVSVKEIQKKYQPKVTKPKKVGTLERLATPKPRKPRFLLRWSPTGRLFDQEGKLVASSTSESQYDCSNGDNACTSNAMEPKIKRFPNSTSLLDRLFRFVYGVDLLKGDRSTNLYTINLNEMASASPICLMACASSTKSWLWHQRLSHLNFDTINDLARNDLVTCLLKFKYHKEHLCPSCEQGKSKRASHPSKPVLNSRQRLYLLHMDLCGRMRIASINGKRVYNRRTKKIIKTMNVSFDELSAMAFEQHSLKPGLQSMTSVQISSGLDLTYALSTITKQQPSEGELDLLFEAMNDDYIGGQPSATARTALPAQEPQVRQTSTSSTTIADTAPTPTNSSSHATNIIITSQDVNELNPNAMVDGNAFVNPFTNSSTCDAESSSSQNVDPSNMHTFYQPYPHEFQWTKDHPLEQTKDKLDLDQNGTSVDAMKYRSMIGALMYLTSSRPDIVQATCLCAWYQAKPTKKHLKEVKRIFRYLWGTINMGLWYTKDSTFELTGFSDADYAGCKDTFKSTSGGAQFLGEKLVSWSLKKQDYTTLSIAKAEYVSLSA
uniref:Uncharacterized mitochondrial protein AtMg00810-like n=1 Tax=Tanacetum cinerariifolium TaxID=118510 RepID=A0A6L2LRU8_TANCI|nr:uncharacterized mitochondrial protein AtMg00810-like [Tanacetum cinerariifolium]